MRTGCMWAALKWLLTMLCGAVIVCLLARTCSFSPDGDPVREEQDVSFATTDSGAEVERSYTVSEVPSPKDLDALNWVSNPDGILSDETVGEINGLLNELEDSLSIEVAVVALNSIGEEEPRSFAYELFNYWGVGKSSVDNGLLVQLVLDRREVTFETGYGLEGVLPDVICYRIQQEAMVPWLARNDFNTGMLEGVRAITWKLYGSDYTGEMMQQPELSWWSDMDAGSWIVLLIFTLIIGGSNTFVFCWLCRYFRPKNNTAEAALDVRFGKRFITWGNCMILLFLPLWPAFLLGFLWYWLWQRWYLIRRGCVCPRCGKYSLSRLSRKEEASRFSKAQNLENKLHSVVHRVYRCQYCQEELVYHKVLVSSYSECKKCHTHAQKRVGAWKTIKRATYSSEGTREAEFRCLSCGEKMIVKGKIARLSRGGSGSGSSGGGGGSRGSFGGGHSGGGGASSRF